MRRRRRDLRRAPRRALVAAHLVLLGAACTPDAGPIGSTHFVLRRAALELTAGRPDAAREVLGRRQADPHGSELEAMAALLQAEAELLCRRPDRARPALERL